jgi:hypothetical protein
MFIVTRAAERRSLFEPEKLEVIAITETSEGLKRWLSQIRAADGGQYLRHVRAWQEIDLPEIPR